MHNEQIYTPSKVVNFMLDNVGFNNKCSIEGKHIIDNSCGNGNLSVNLNTLFIHMMIVESPYHMIIYAYTLGVY